MFTPIIHCVGKKWYSEFDARMSRVSLYFLLLTLYITSDSSTNRLTYGLNVFLSKKEKNHKFHMFLSENTSVCWSYDTLSYCCILHIKVFSTLQLVKCVLSFYGSHGNTCTCICNKCTIRKSIFILIDCRNVYWLIIKS